MRETELNKTVVHKVSVLIEGSIILLKQLSTVPLNLASIQQLRKNFYSYGWVNTPFAASDSQRLHTQKFTF